MTYAHASPATGDSGFAIPPNEREIYAAAGYGQEVELGKKPALLIVDATYNFTGDRPAPILDSIKTFSNSCGEVAWESVAVIASLQRTFREAAKPILMTWAPRKSIQTLGGWARTNRRAAEVIGDDPGERFPDIIAPTQHEILLDKTKPSAFFGTPLPAILRELDVDTLVVCGGTTSGCVRATVVDAFSYGYRVAVAKEATFDRATIPHLANLFDMDQKYANVMSKEEVEAYISTVTVPE